MYASITYTISYSTRAVLFRHAFRETAQLSALGNSLHLTSFMCASTLSLLLKQ
jgi:hypothetical protein